ncbi:MAG: hypothetical protein IPJ21_13365 [Sterolibacteriaceae bacterium]|jgi:NADH:ubiquinone oxidoreductase subunit 5 (subunit L)/multisubunit Na+/H+ antiporter MnhA subunit|nr:hypothetical protein [Sterolibacteriaceae bacterium]MBK9084783.1 hypothetical protein [Sterolibacteriaceae bacterium]
MNPAALVAIVPLAPLAAALLIGAALTFRRHDGDAAERPSARIAVAGGALALLVMLLLDGLALVHGAPGQVWLGTWFSAGRFEIPLSFTLDALSLGFGTLVALIAFLTLRFSVNYMHREPGFHRYFFGLSLFAAGMLTLVLAGNSALAFVGWELAGVSSYLLIGYAWERASASENAVRAFVTNRIGDAGFIVGIAATFHWVGTAEWPGFAAGVGALDTLAAGLMAFGFVVAALAKSAQVPFAPWIARALEGPTPSSAIFYGALMVHAGVFLLIRIEPLLIRAPALMALLVLLGLASALYGWLSGLTQTDVKSALTFATTTQVGLMFLWCGLGWFDLAAWHLALHASWRAYQFLLAPSYMHLLDGPTRPVPSWLGRRRRLYTAALQRFWLEPVADWLLVRPTRGLGRDVNAFDEQVVDRLIGRGETGRAESADEVARGYGALGWGLESLSRGLARFEARLLMEGGGGRLGQLLTRVGEYLQAIETLLERPRYLLLLVMVTFVVIL